MLTKVISHALAACFVRTRRSFHRTLHANTETLHASNMICCYDRLIFAEIFIATLLTAEASHHLLPYLLTDGFKHFIAWYRVP